MEDFDEGWQFFNEVDFFRSQVFFNTFVRFNSSCFIDLSIMKIQLVNRNG